MCATLFEAFLVFSNRRNEYLLVRLLLMVASYWMSVLITHCRMTNSDSQASVSGVGESVHANYYKLL
uniref:Secreted protein n=1 Tax=Ascaris lumbricoides TaxID=6252 RepID=A0A0M3IFN2_ASCLU